MGWLNKFVDCIVYINLDERTDRNKKCQETLHKVNIQPYYRVSAIKDTIGIRGCTLTHYNIIKHAKENNYKNILIFEDDFTIVDVNNFKSNLLNSFQQIESNNLTPHMLYLGGNLNTGFERNISKIDNNLFKINGAKATHSYIIYSNLYDVILEKYKNIDINDINTWRGPNRANIDFYYVSEIHMNKKYNIYGCYPCLTDQIFDYSNIECKMVKYDLARSWNLILSSISD